MKYFSDSRVTNVVSFDDDLRGLFMKIEEKKEDEQLLLLLLFSAAGGPSLGQLH